MQLPSKVIELLLERMSLYLYRRLCSVIRMISRKSATPSANLLAAEIVPESRTANFSRSWLSSTKCGRAAPCLTNGRNSPISASLISRMLTISFFVACTLSSQAYDESRHSGVGRSLVPMIFLFVLTEFLSFSSSVYYPFEVYLRILHTLAKWSARLAPLSSSAMPTIRAETIASWPGAVDA